MNVMMNSIGRSVAAAGVALVIPVAAHAVDTTWTAGTGSYTDGANYDTGNAPTAGDNTFINNGGTAQITTGDSAVANELTLGFSAVGVGTIEMDGGTLTTGAGSNFNVGRAGTGTMNVTGGTVTSPFLQIGNGTGSTGTVTVDNAVWNAGSAEQRIGANGTGSLTLTNGASMSLGNNSAFGRFATGSGTGVVNGVGTVLNGQGLYVGRQGFGNLIIENGGLVDLANWIDIDDNKDADGSSVDLRTGGMLALPGNLTGDTNPGGPVDYFDDSFGHLFGAPVFRYWDGSDWDDISNATQGVDYTLVFDSGNGHTVLTVGVVPEPSSLGLLAAGTLAFVIRRRRVVSP